MATTKKGREIYIYARFPSYSAKMAGTSDAIAVEVDGEPIRMSDPPSLHHGKNVENACFHLAQASRARVKKQESDKGNR
jgi:hypothetical protein